MSDIDDELFALAGGDEEADVEEGEASSPAASSPNSLGSDAMEESDSDGDDDPPARPADVPYPLDAKYTDEADKRRILALSQLEREEILGQRAEEMSRANFTAELARRAATLHTHRKRKLDDDDDARSDDARSDNAQPARAKPKARVNDKLEEYKRNREQRGQQRDRDTHRQDRRTHPRRSASPDRDPPSDLDADGESDVEWDDRPPKPREDLPAQLPDFEAVRVGRGFFADVCFYPGFDHAVTGTFARLGVGQDSQRRTMYKMAQIRGINTGKPYVFEGKNGKLATDQYVVAQHGATTKDYQFHFLSNQRFDDRDLDLYKHSLADSASKLPTKSFLDRKYNDLKTLHNHHWTEPEINARIAKKKQYAHLLHRNSLDAQPRIQTQSEAAAVKTAELNRLNRLKEAERVRRVQLDQQRQKKLDQKKEAARKRAELDARTARDDATTDALFADDAAAERASTPRPAERTARKGLPTFRKPKTDDDFIASMDLDFDIAI